MNTGKAVLVFLVVFWTAVVTNASNVYIAQNSAGANTGADATDARSLAWLNANWSSVNPGDTVHLCGTLIKTLSIGASGTAGSPITILFEPGANFTSPAWGLNSDAAIWLNRVSYITIDGGGAGIIQCTNNGTLRGLRQNAAGVMGQGLTGVMVKNLIVTNIYIHAYKTTNDANRFGYDIDLGDSDSVLSGGLSVLNCKLSDADTTIAFIIGAGVSSNYTIAGNTLQNVNHGVTIALSESSAFPCNITIASNTIDHMSLYDNDPDNSFHRDGIIVQDETANRGAISNLCIYANTFGRDYGINTTAAIFVDDYYAYQEVGLRIYNNLFLSTQPSHWNNGFISIGGCTNGSLVANNTFYDSWGGGGLGVSPDNATVTNNIFWNVSIPLYVTGEGITTTPPPLFKSDNNVFAWPNGTPPQFVVPGLNRGSFSQLQTAGYDAHSSTNTPSLDSNYAPISSDTVANGKGTSLSSCFTIDLNGNVRTRPWTIGAFQMAGTNGSNSLPLPPTLLHPSR